jgi:hypothetical protein
MVNMEQLLFFYVSTLMFRNRGHKSPYHPGDTFFPTDQRPSIIVEISGLRQIGLHHPLFELGRRHTG